MNDTPKVTLLRLFADARGKSHFGEVQIRTFLKTFAPPAPPMYTSDSVEAKGTLFLVLPAGWRGGLHPAPKRQLMGVVKGMIEVTAGDGEKRSLWPGDFILVEDTSGEGHETRNLGRDPVVMSVTQY